jgi:nitronate monooxygenase
MAGACPPSLLIAIANAGYLGACGTLSMEPEAIRAWSAEFRRQSQGEFQLNLWIPEPVSVRDFELEKSSERPETPIGCNCGPGKPPN